MACPEGSGHLNPPSGAASRTQRCLCFNKPLRLASVKPPGCWPEGWRSRAGHRNHSPGTGAPPTTGIHVQLGACFTHSPDRLTLTAISPPAPCQVTPNIQSVRSLEGSLHLGG